MIPKPALESSPTIISTSSTVRAFLVVLITRGWGIDMIPTTMFTVIVCGVIERRYVAFGRWLRSTSRLDASLVLTNRSLEVTVLHVSNDVELSLKVVEKDLSESGMESVV